jgi:homoserine dehydrogenase
MRIALLGLGTVGGAVAGRLVDEEWRRSLAKRGVRSPELSAVGVRDPSRPRGVRLPDSVERTGDLQRLVERGDVDVVVELLGGLEPAGELIGRALEAGKSVVSANKALLAERGPQLEAVARRSGAHLRFEAAVAAGIPILGPLGRDLAANRLDRVRGIVNGTTNFMLSAMAEEQREYDAVLADAQLRGYAEADPSADVDGRDAASKLVLLTRLAFGAWLRPAQLPTRGITAVTAADMISAAGAGLTIKLIASAARPPDGRIEAWVEPCAVARRSPIGATDGVTNVVEVDGWPVGRVVFQGPGAGGDATSSAILGDLLALARGEGSTWASLAEAEAETEGGTIRRSEGRLFGGYRVLED